MRTCSRVSRGSLRRGCLPLLFPCPLPLSPSPSLSLSPFFPFPLFPGCRGYVGGGCTEQRGWGASGRRPIHTLSHPQPFAQDLISPRPQFPVFRPIRSEPGGGHAAGRPPPGWRSRGEHRAKPPSAKPRAQLGTRLPGASPPCCCFGLCVSRREPPGVNLRQRPILPYLCSQWDPSRSFILPL